MIADIMLAPLAILLMGLLSNFSADLPGKGEVPCVGYHAIHGSETCRRRLVGANQDLLHLDIAKCPMVFQSADQLHNLIRRRQKGAKPTAVL